MQTHYSFLVVAFCGWFVLTPPNTPHNPHLCMQPLIYTVSILKISNVKEVFSFCLPELEYLIKSCRPYYLLRSFLYQYFFIVVYLPLQTDVGTKTALNELYRAIWKCTFKMQNGYKALPCPPVGRCLIFLFNLYLTRQVSEEQILIYNDVLPKGKRPPAGMGAGMKNVYKYRTKHTSRQERQHYIKRDPRQQHSKAATHDNKARKQHNMTTTW
jgi:hypothetical protein